MKLVLLLLLVVAANANHFFPLSNFYSDIDARIPVTPGSVIFVSSQDNQSYLTNITFSVDGKDYTADQLANSYVEKTSEKTGLTVAGKEFKVVTRNPDTITNYLLGSIYVVDPDVVKNTKFHVYDLKDTIKFEVADDGADKILTFFTARKVNLAGSPYYHAQLTFSNVKNGSRISVKNNVAADNIVSSEIFRNPVTLQDKSKKFFTHIEPLPIYYRFFQMTVSGPQSILVENKYDNSTERTATANTTTGLMSSNYDLNGIQKVNLVTDLNRNGITGVLYYQHVIYPINVTFISPYAQMDAVTLEGTQNVTGQIESPMVYSEIDVDCLSKLTGEYFIQYYIIEGDVLASTHGPITKAVTKTTNAAVTVPIVTTDASVETTTKEASGNLLIVPLVLTVVSKLF